MELEYPISKNEYDLQICSFIKPKQNSIQSLSYSKELNLLAVGRTPINQIDFYRHSSYTNILSIKLNKDQIISKVQWFIKNISLLLVSCRDGLLFICDPNCNFPISKLLIPGGGINDMNLTKDFNNLALGCDDGAIRIYNSSNNDVSWELIRTTRSFKSRCLSVVWDEKLEFYGSFQNGTIRKFDFKTNVIFMIKITEANVFCWKMLVFNKDLICGCNDGKIRILENKFGVINQELNTHKGDILEIISNGNDCIYVSGVDSRIMVLEQMNGKYSVNSIERGQSHDIHSMVLINDNTLISGGLTTDLCLYKLENGKFLERNVCRNDLKTQKKLRHISSLNENFSIFVGGNKIIFTQNFTIEVWSFNFKKYESCFIAELKTNENPIISSDISNCGSYFGYSIESEIKVFEIKDLEINLLIKIELENCVLLKFNSLSTKLFIINSNNDLHDLDLFTKKSNFLLKLGKNKEKINFNVIDKDKNSDLICLGSRFSNKIIVVDPYLPKIVFEIPYLLTNIGFINFKFRTERELFILYENNKFAFFDLRTKSLNNWSIKNINKFPVSFLNNFNKFIDVIFHPITNTKLMIYSNFSYAFIDLEAEIPNTINKLKGENIDNLKKAGNFDIISREKPILNWILTSESELTLFESDWKILLRDMPDALNTKNFGF